MTDEHFKPKTKDELEKIEKSKDLLPDPGSKVVGDLINELYAHRQYILHILEKQSMMIGINEQDRMWIEAFGLTIEEVNVDEQTDS